MEGSSHSYLKLTALLLLFTFIFYYVLFQINRNEFRNTFQVFYQIFNRSRIINLFMAISNTTIIANTSYYLMNMTTIIKHIPSTTTTASTARPTTLDPALLLVERPPSTSRLYSNNGVTSTLAVFLFHTQHHVLADLQLYLIRKLATDLVAIELFVDGSLSAEMHNVAMVHKAELHINWAIDQRAKRYLGNNTAILLLDGDVFPLSPFDSTTLLNSRDIVCRKHPALFARFCWIGFICLAPQLYDTIDNFDVSQTLRHGQAYDSGGKTIEYFLKYENASFSWMKETIFLGRDTNLFWGSIDNDIQWIKSNFSPCDKCGPEIFFSPFNNSNAVFYHMISATSEWRFGHQASRRQSIHDSIMKSPYGPNKTYAIDDMISSVRKVQKMKLIPFFGDLTCEKMCKG
ncbi:hypothetical protein I4U23_019676 [Adineta vaga]|nr:hypothetical protein I4U23_019676 [Adineta vaga]